MSRLWLDLERRATPNFFLSWHWIGAWLLQAELRPWMLVGRVQGEVAVLGALTASRRHNFGPAAIAGLRLHTTGIADIDVITIEYNGFLVDAAHGDAAEDAALDFLIGDFLIGTTGATGQRCDELDLRNVSRRYRAYAESRRLIHRIAGRKPSYRVDLDGVRASGRPYLDRLSSNTRQQIRRSMRLYQAIGPVVLTRAETVDEAVAFLAGLKALHQPYWQSRGEPGAFAYPFLEALMHRLMIAGLADGTVELVRVSRGELAIGYLYNFVYRGQVYCYQCGFLFEADARLKPGLVAHTLCIEDHLRTGVAIYDFMGGEARYKSSLGQPGPDLHYVLLQRPTAIIRAENALRRLRDRSREIRGTAVPTPQPAD